MKTKINLLFLSKLKDYLSGDTFEFDTETGDYTHFICGIGDRKSYCEYGVAVTVTRVENFHTKDIIICNELGHSITLHQGTFFNYDWAKAFPKINYDYRLNNDGLIKMKKKSVNGQQKFKKVYLGWAIREATAAFCRGSISWLTIFDHDLRMGSHHEKIIFTHRDLAVEQLRAMRKLQKKNKMWCAFNELQLVRLFKMVTQ